MSHFGIDPKHAHTYFLKPSKDSDIHATFKSHLRYIEIDKTSFIVSYYEEYFRKYLSQKVLTDFLLGMLEQSNKQQTYITNLLFIISGLDLTPYEIDVTPFKSLVKQDNAEVTEAILQFIERQPHFFTKDFIKSLSIDIEWLNEYRDEILEGY